MAHARTLRQILCAFPYLGPFLAVHLVFLVYPFAAGIWMSVHEVELLGQPPGSDPSYVGLQHYAALFADPVFRAAARHTVQFVAMTVPVITVTALALALSLNRRGSWFTAMRAVFSISAVLSVSVVTLVWLLVLNPSRGLVGALAAAAGVRPFDVLTDRHLALPAVALTTVWWSVGLPLALFIAALQQIPRERYEAAELDHAGAWTMFRHITLPAIRPTVWLVVMLEAILHVQVFGQVLLMTRGGPAHATTVLVQYLYESSFRDWQVGYASAVGLVIFAIMVSVSLLQRLGARMQGGSR
jgi:multiple sugar transport system permease protein